MLALIPQRRPGVLLTNSVVEICPRVLFDLARVLAAVLLASARSPVLPVPVAPLRFLFLYPSVRFRIPLLLSLQEQAGLRLIRKPEPKEVTAMGLNRSLTRVLQSFG